MTEIREYHAPIQKVDITDAELAVTIDEITLGAGNENIGNVDVVTLPALPAGTNNIGNVDTSEVWRVSQQSDADSNDSDKMFTVPATTEWQILSIWVSLVTTSSIGNRQIVVELSDNANYIVGRFIAGNVQAASETCYYMFASGVELMTDFVSGYLSFPLPSIFLPAGYKVRVYDAAGIDPTHDDMVVRMMIASRTV